jgi:copper homeostasis protein
LKYIIEIATADFNTTKNAVEGGADRIELCAALGDGGTTPSAGMMRLCREHFSIPIFPIIRPRGGDFFYNDAEFKIMHADVVLARELGCDGIVTGLLEKDGNIDIRKTSKLVESAYPMEVSFHRAFDRCRDPWMALEQLIEIGCSRLLTSGQQLTAPEGMEMIKELIQTANERIVIMPGSGVRKENIRELADQTGAVEFHSSLRSKLQSAMTFIHPSFVKTEESYFNAHIDPEAVMDLRKALQ